MIFVTMCGVIIKYGYLSMFVCFDPSLNILKLDGVEVSLHCHHYNCGLVKALEEITEIDARRVFVQAATEQFYLNFKYHIASHANDKSIPEKLKAAAELYRLLGFGRVDLSRLNEDGGTANADSSYYVVGWLAKYGRRETPVCHLTCGFLAGILAAVHGKEQNHYTAEETRCMVTGHDQCEFVVSVNEP